MTIVVEPLADKEVLSWEPHDIWAGVYWKFKRVISTHSWELRLYICPVPTVLIAFRIERLPND